MKGVERAQVEHLFAPYREIYNLINSDGWRFGDALSAVERDYNFTHWDRRILHQWDADDIDPDWLENP